MPADSTLLLAILFVIAAGAGWAFARYADSRERQADAAQLSADYYRGLNYLLNQKPDEALEVFMRMMELDDDAIETHLLLGSLFRRRGEVDRAIKIHQNIVARPNLGKLQKDQALYALGEDYLKAGLFDRAEELFEQLIDSETHSVDALEGLVSIYEQEKEWQKAIEARQRLEKQLKPDDNDIIAHYYCELAERARQAKQFSEARQFLRKARTGRKRTARGAMMRADIAQQLGDVELAVKLYERTVQADPELLAEVLPRARRCFLQGETLDSLRFSRLLESWLSRNPDIQAELAYASIVTGITDSPVIERAVLAHIRENPTLSALFFDLLDKEQDEQSRAVRKIQAALASLSETAARYRCRNCGFSGATLYWQCPSCKNWDSIRPISHFRFETLLDPHIDSR